MGRFISASRRTARRVTRAPRKLFNLSRGAPKDGIMGAIARPISRVAAPAVAVVGVAYLVLAPLANGDSWERRILNGWSSYKETGRAVDILDQDADGNDAISIAFLQIKGNFWTFLGMEVGAGVIAGVGRWVGA